MPRKFNPLAKKSLDYYESGSGSGTGDVVGPVSSTNNAVARYDSTTGKVLKDSSVIVDDLGNISTSGTIDGRDVSADGTKLDGIESGAEVNNISDVNAIDLTDGGDSTLHYHASDRNTDNHVSGTTNKIYTATEQTKLAGIEAGAEVNNISDLNATDLTDGGNFTGHYHANDRARANHTGSQAISTVTDLQATLDSKVDEDTLAYNVTDYGATGDGTTNDTTAIQAAFNAIGTAGGGTAFFPVGTYIVGGLTIPSNIKLQGEGAGSLLKNASAANAPVITNNDKVAGNTNITIENLGFDGDKANQTSSYSTVQIEKATNVYVHGCTFTGGARLVQGGPGGEGIELKNVQYARVANCYSYSNDYDGIKIREGCTDITITGNVCRNNGAGGVQGYLSDRIAITGNQIYSATSPSTYSAWTRGITLHTVTYSTVAGNVIEGPGKANTTGVGLKVLETSDYNTFIGNQVKGMYRGVMFNSTRTPINRRNFFNGTHLTACEIAIDLMSVSRLNNFTNTYAENCVTFVRAEVAAGESNLNYFQDSILEEVTNVYTAVGTGGNTYFKNTIHYNAANGIHEVKPGTSNLQTGAIAYVSRTTDSATTGTTEIIADTVTFSLPHNRRIRIRWEGLLRSTVAGDRGRVRLRQGSTISDTLVQLRDVDLVSSGGPCGIVCSRTLELGAGDYTFIASIHLSNGTGTMYSQAGATFPTEFIVEDLGPAS